MFEDGNSFTTEIESKEEGQGIMEDMKYLEEVKFSAAILPANSTVKEISKKIKRGDTISISGIHFRHDEIKENGTKRPLPKCLSNVDVFYVSELKILN